MTQTNILTPQTMYGDDGFLLPENFTIEANGLKFCYNEYEIGSYSQGAPSILVPYSKIEGLLKPGVK